MSLVVQNQSVHDQVSRLTNKHTAHKFFKLGFRNLGVKNKQDFPCELERTLVLLPVALLLVDEAQSLAYSFNNPAKRFFVEFFGHHVRNESARDELSNLLKVQY